MLEDFTLDKVKETCQLQETLEKHMQALHIESNASNIDYINKKRPVNNN